METNANTAFLKIFISKKKFYNQSQGMPTDMTHSNAMIWKI